MKSRHKPLFESKPARLPAPLASRHASVPGLDVWVSDGTWKQHSTDLQGPARRTPVWDGMRARVRTPRRAWVGLCMHLEAPASPVAVRLQTSVGQLFEVRDVQIRGLSRIGYDGMTYDERHIPKPFRAPHGPDGSIRPGATWKDRPHADTWYPDILVPVPSGAELQIPAGERRLVWLDVWIPADEVADMTFEVGLVSGDVVTSVPVHVQLVDLTLPLEPEHSAWTYIEPGNVRARHGVDGRALDRVLERYLRELWSHGVMVISKDNGREPPGWIRGALDGSLFSEESGYRGLGQGRAYPLYSIGTYGGWRGQWGEEPEQIRANLTRFRDWMRRNAPDVLPVWYVWDEPYARGEDFVRQVERWARAGVPTGVPRLVTVPLTRYDRETGRSTDWTDLLPSVNLPLTGHRWGNRVERAAAAHKAAEMSPIGLAMYNGHRPAGGSFMIEDDGVALLAQCWGDERLGVKNRFYWEATYWKDLQDGEDENRTGNPEWAHQTNVWTEARTFGDDSSTNEELRARYGQHGYNPGNGDGVLLRPGTDRIYPEHSLGMDGPIPSYRLKLWRLGLQDRALIQMARAKDAARTQAILEGRVPIYLWEQGVSDPRDPSYLHMRDDPNWDTPYWSTDPADWHASRDRLIEVALG